MRITPETLTAKLIKAAAGGETLELVGAFGDLRLSGQQWSRPITLDCSRATLGAWYWSKVSGVRVLGGEARSWKFDDAQDIEVERVGFPGDGRKGTGLQFVRGAHVAGRRCTFRDYKNAQNFSQCDDFEAIGHWIEHMRSDGVQAGMSHRGLIAGNTIKDTEVEGEEHADGIQLWSRPTVAPTSDIVIEHNVILGATGGINGFDHTRDGVPDGGFERITIRENLCWIGWRNGVALYNGRGVTLDGNDIRSLDGGRGQARILLPGCSGITLGRPNTFGPGDGRPGGVFAAPAAE